jgi:hypothetical protein
MSRKNILRPFKMLNAVSMASNQTSSVTNVVNIDIAHILVEWSGTSPVGTLAVQARHNQESTNITGSWFDLDGLSAIAISGNTGSHQILLNELPFSEIRLVYTFTSGTGSLTATIQGKVVGA